MENYSFGTNLFFLVLFICDQMLFGCCVKPYSNISCSGSERRALLEFKNGLIDESNRLSSWTGENYCTWEGIGCDMRTGRVVKLDLHNPFDEERYHRDPDKYLEYYYTTSLKGGISPSLLNLKYLQHLDLSHNNFSGHKNIPIFFGSFKYMRYLNLSSSQFHGQIPTNLGNLSRLQYLDLSGNDIHSSKSLWWITTLPSLKSLDLTVVNLSGANDWLEAVNMLPSLLSLNLGYCSLQYLSILPNTNFTSLVSLDLSGNHFNTSFPLWLFNVSSVEILSLSENLFQGELPNSLCTLTSLTQIFLSGNSFQGKIPFCFDNLTSVTILHLRSNRLQDAIPFRIGHLRKLTQLDLSFNKLNGTIPPSLWQLEKLQSLDISGNLFTGEVTEVHFAKLTQLIYLDLSWNSLRLSVNSQWFPPFQLHKIGMGGIQVGPQFPQWLETQKRVEELVMYNASISDQIPNWFIYSQINILVLSHNEISGRPPQIKSHGIIDLSFNKFAGQITPLDGNETWYLILNDNGFTGNIPTTICNQVYLLRLDLSNNQLSGEIPFCLGDLKYLEYLNLANNSFFGKIPASFQNLTILILLHLGNNQLSGSLPKQLGTNLVWLSLQSNNLNGSIPSELCKLSKLHVLNLAQNNFSGFIPRCFGNFTAMKNNLMFQSLQSNLIYFIIYIAQIDKEHELISNPIKGSELKYSRGSMLPTSITLSENEIVGEMPKELMDLGNLQSLNLSKNHLHGRIPDSIGNLKRLESLDLSMNQLSGSIPRSLATVDTLGYLNLSFNKLSGPIPEGSHFQTFDDTSIYEGNRGLCGKPISDNCTDNKKPSKKGGSINLREGDSFDIPWFYAGIGPGFAVGFVGVFSILWFKKSWRYAYVRFVENLCSPMQRNFSRK